MKTSTTFIVAALALITLSSCANGKKLQRNPPTAFQTAYYITVPGETERDLSSYELFIPVGEREQEGLELNMAYFRGRKAKLELRGAGTSVYSALFENAGRSNDIVMSSDPLEEYGNKAPVLNEKIPFELKPDEVVVEFTKNGKVGYFKIEGVTERTAE